MANMKIQVLVLHIMVGLSFQHGHVCESLGGELVNGRCFIFHDYKKPFDERRFDELRTWEAAKQHCVNTYGGQLATSDDPHAFWEYVSKHYGLKDEYFFVWTGGHKTTKEGPWKWLDGKTTVPSPRGSYLDDVGCLMLHRGGYNSIYCDCPCYGHICEVWL